jgi:hypothetical protein
MIISQEIVDVIGPDTEPIIQIAERSNEEDEWQAGQSYTLADARQLFAELGRALYQLDGGPAEGEYTLTLPMTEAVGGDWIDVGTEDDGRAYVAVAGGPDVITLAQPHAAQIAAALLAKARA